ESFETGAQKRVSHAGHKTGRRQIFRKHSELSLVVVGRKAMKELFSCVERASAVKMIFGGGVGTVVMTLELQKQGQKPEQKCGERARQRGGGPLCAGIVPVRFENGETQILLLRAYKDWDFPKGGVEAGEDPFDGALRELKEETGLSAVEFPWGLSFLE